MENKQEKEISPSNSLLTMLIWTLCTVWLLLYDSEMLKQTWGNWMPFKYNNAYPITTLFVLGLIFLFFKNERRMVLAERSKKEAEERIMMAQQATENVISQMQVIYDSLVEQDNYLAINVKNIINNFGNKLELTELKGHPEVTNYLISKKIESENNGKVIFDFEICSDITKLDCIPASDINKILGIIMDQITEVQKDSDDKEVGVLIREENEWTIFEYIYNGVLIATNQDSNITSTNWHIVNKIARKHGGKVTAAQEDECSIIRFWLPYDRPQCRILKTLSK